MMNKYFYFAVVRFEEVTIAGQRTKRAPVTYFGKNVYSNAGLAIIANIGWICNHVGERFAVCGFEHQLDLVDGVSQGYLSVDDDDAVISLDLKGAIKLLKTNLKLCNVNL